MESLPDLSGQPAWVIVVVVGLTAIGSVAGAVVQRGEKRRKKRRVDRDNEDERAVGEGRSVPSLPSGQVDVLHTSIQAIIESGRRADEEAEQARAETRAVRMRLEAALIERSEAIRARDRAIADVDHCEAIVRRLRAELNGDIR